MQPASTVVAYPEGELKKPHPKQKPHLFCTKNTPTSCFHGIDTLLPAVRGRLQITLKGPQLWRILLCSCDATMATPEITPLLGNDDLRGSSDSAESCIPASCSRTTNSAGKITAIFDDITISSNFDSGRSVGTANFCFCFIEHASLAH